MIPVTSAPFQWPDYARLDAYRRRHHERYVRHIAAMPRKLMCQECGGGGDIVDTDGYGQVEQVWQCGWCEGTGYVTPHTRGLWLRSRRTPNA